MQMHRRQWKCEECEVSFSTKTWMERHLNKAHSVSATENQLQLLVDLSERQADEAQVETCPFCSDTMSLQCLFVHMADHMEQLAWLSLTRSARETVEEEGSTAAQKSRPASPARSGPERLEPARSHGNPWGSSGRANDNAWNANSLIDAYMPEPPLSRRELIPQWGHMFSRYQQSPVTIRQGNGLGTNHASSFIPISAQYSFSRDHETWDEPTSDTYRDQEDGSRRDNRR